MVSVIDINNSYQNYNQRTQNYSNPLRRAYFSYDNQQPVIPDNNDSSKTIATFGLLQIASIALQKASKWFGDKLMRGKEFTSFENVAKVAQTMIDKNKLNVSAYFINKDNIKKFPEYLRNALTPVANSENAFYMDSAKLAVAPEKKPSLILHELGHAINASKGKFLRFLQKSRIYSAYVPTVVLLANNMLQDKGCHSDFIEKHAGLIGFLAFLPTVIEEGLASYRGVNAAKKVLGKTANLKILKKNYFTAWLTYLIGAIGLGVASKAAVIANKNPNI